jgi:hypothetical protein
MPQHIITDKVFAYHRTRPRQACADTRPPEGSAAVHPTGQKSIPDKKNIFFHFCRKTRISITIRHRDHIRGEQSVDNPQWKPLFRDFEAFQRQIQPYAKKPIFAMS